MQEKKWYSLLATQLCACASMPLLVIGFKAAKSYSVQSWLQILLSASSISLCLAYGMIKAIKNRPMTSAELFTETLGEKYSKIISYGMACISIVWLVVHVQFIEELFKQLSNLGDETLRFISILTLIFSCFIIKYGTRVLAILAYAAIALLALITWNIYTHQIPITFVEKANPSIFPEIALFVIINSFNIYNTATYYQQSKSENDSMTASGLLYGIFIPLIATIGYLISSVFFNTKNLQECCTYSSDSLANSLLLFLIISGHGNIFNNLYGASQSIKNVLPNLLKNRGIFISAAAGYIILSAGIAKNLISAVNLVNIPINAIGSVIIAQQLFNITKVGNIITIVTCASTLGLLGYLLLPHGEISFVITMALSSGLLFYFSKSLRTLNRHN